MATKKAAPKKARSARWVLVGMTSYGLYIGKTSATDAEILATKAVRLTECRHVRYWYGKTGGITSLAAFGPCGPRKMESKIGAPCSALISDVKNVYDLSPEAVVNFASIEAK